MGESDQADDGLCGCRDGTHFLSPLVCGNGDSGGNLIRRGPCLVALNRITLGKKFAMYKFRSMVDRAHEMKDQLTEFNVSARTGPVI